MTDIMRIIRKLPKTIIVDGEIWEKVEYSSRPKFITISVPGIESLSISEQYLRVLACCGDDDL